MKKIILLLIVSMLLGCSVEPKDTVEISFADISNLEFCFTSGAGAWCTLLYINEDGTFRGNFMDTNMGDTGVDYPKGTVYYSDFYGQFTQLKKVDSKTYTFEIAYIEYSHESGEEIKDGTKYIYTSAFGLDGAEKLYLYLPGKNKAELPEGYKSWLLGYETKEERMKPELSFYGIYNESDECGFCSMEF